ncbi:GNAT family N-acetyltransferase [Conexibacter woesei]|uniref:GNAT family N-acetyltransferase n=1 Tax=Conexibacter woesei TaxID=191495 RepID=UPI0002FEAA5A|nr:GNAT family N-acetyltransferase [Conexibacter woesei]
MQDELRIRNLTAGDTDGFRACLDVAFHETTTDASLRRWWQLLDLDRTIVVLDGDTIVATSGAFPQRLSVPGGELASAGVTVVTVLPTHRRRGILTRMMARLFEQAAAAGEPLAGLWAAEGGIYGRFGYGVATQVATLELDGGSPPPPRSQGADFTLELLPLDGAGPLLDPLWERVRAQRAGVPARTEQWWSGNVLSDLEDEREGAHETRLVVARDAAGAAQGYALYRARDAEPATTVEVLELIAPDTEAEATLWGYFRQIDLVGRVKATGRPVDDPLKFRFDDFEAAHVADVNDALWLRLLDLPAAVAGRAWAAPLDLVLDVTDRRLPANAGSWRLEASAQGDGRCSPTDRAPDLALDVAALGAAYLGGVSPVRLADAGRIAELTPGALARLDVALHTPRAPWTPEDF